MGEEHHLLLRGFEIYQLSPADEECSECLLKRSNAVRRRHRPPLLPHQRVETSDFQNSNKQNRFILQRNLTKGKNTEMNKIKRILHRRFIHDRSNVPWFLMWKFRKIHP